MKRIAQLIILTILLTACAAPSADLSAASPDPSATQTLTPKNTSTALRPTLTPDTLTPGTPTRTPLPTIPTFTPTFDARTIVTATPAPKAKCPVENPLVTLDLKISETIACNQPSNIDAGQNPFDCINRSFQEDIFDFLNNGGMVNVIIEQFREARQKEGFVFFRKDLTNDNLTDYIFRDPNNPFAGYFIYFCRNGRYEHQSIFDGDPYANNLKITTIHDINADGMPEIVAEISNVMIVLEWNGESFVEIGAVRDFGDSKYDIQDINSDGLVEIIFNRGYPGSCCEYLEWPWRKYEAIYGWNSSMFIEISRTYDKPVYRFQAIQDADKNVLQRHYENALTLYQDVIFNEELDWWSASKREYTYEYQWATTPLYFGEVLQPTETVPTPPAPDPTEYPRLAAYAYYRMVILHTFLSEMEAAQVKYATLQEKFPAESPGHPYVEMAIDFWDAYQSSGLMYEACAAAIAYADAHPEILIPLGSDYHGAQSHQYQPADVCPFR